MCILYLEDERRAIKYPDVRCEETERTSEETSDVDDIRRRLETMEADDGEERTEDGDAQAAAAVEYNAHGEPKGMGFTEPLNDVFRIL